MFAGLLHVAKEAGTRGKGIGHKLSWLPDAE